LRRPIGGGSSASSKRTASLFEKRNRKGTGHWVGEKQGVLRPVIIPEYDSVGMDIIFSNMRTAGMTRERFLKLLAGC
jgi:hypothetical protein